MTKMTTTCTAGTTLYSPPTAFLLPPSHTHTPTHAYTEKGENRTQARTVCSPIRAGPVARDCRSCAECTGRCARLCAHSSKQTWSSPEASHAASFSFYFILFTGPLGCLLSSKSVCTVHIDKSIHSSNSLTHRFIYELILISTIDSA